MFHWKQIFRDAHLYMFGYPSEGQALEMVTELVANQMPAIRTAKSLAEASALFHAWTESTAEIAALPETAESVQINRRMTQAMKALVPEPDASEFVFLDTDAKFALETRIQKMALFQRHPDLSLADRLIYALLEHPRGPKIGYGIYQDTILFDKTHGLN